MTARMQKSLPFALIVALGIVCYLNALGNHFVWDDNSNVVQDRFLRSWQFLPRFFTTDAAEAYDAAQAPVPVYRPLYLVSLFVDYQLWGPNSTMFHLINLVWHLASSVLVFAVLCALPVQPRWALLASLLYVTHPIHVENVAFVAGRNADMSIAFLLVSLLLLLKWCDSVRHGWLVGSLLAFALALLSKEIAASFPAIVVAVLLLRHHNAQFSSRRAVAIVGFYAIILAAYLLVRSTVLTAPTFASLFSWPQRAVLVLESWALTVGLMIAPLNLHHERSLPISWILAGAGALALLVAFVVGVLGWHRDRRITFGIALAFIAFLPTSNLAPLNMTFGERWISWPMVGFLVVLAAVLQSIAERLPSLEQAMWTSTLVIVGVFSAATIVQNRVWHDELTLFRTLIERGGDTVRTQTVLAYDYLDAGDLDRARTHLEIVSQREPRNVAAVRGMGIFANHLGKSREAREWFEKALRIKPFDVGAAEWLAYLQEQSGELQEAERTLRRASVHENSTTTVLKLAEFYLRTDRVDDAQRAVQGVLDKDPMHASAQNLLGNVLFRQGKLDEAERHFRLAIRYDRWLVGAHANLAAVASQRGDLAEALRHYDDAVRLNPTNASLYYAIGVVLNEHGHPAEARRALGRAVEIDPHFEEAKKLLNEK